MSRSSRITIPHRFEYGAFRLVELVLKFFPLTFVFWLGSVLGSAIYLCWGKQRRLVQRSITQAFGDQKNADEITALTKESFRLTCGNLFTSLALPFYEISELRKLVELEGQHLIREALVQKKGVILLVPHMGNWEMMAQVIGVFAEGIEVATHYRPLNNPLVNELIERRRRAKGLRLFAKKTSSHQLCAFLRENKILSILADQRLPSKGDLCSFFGRPTACSPLPSLLARRTGSVLLGLHCETLGPDRWKLSITEVNGRDSQACADNLEAAWRRSPADVFWFQERWKMLSRSPLKPFTRAPFPPQDSITKPLRLKLGGSVSDKSAFPFPDYLYEWVEDDADLILEQTHLDQLMP